MTYASRVWIWFINCLFTLYILENWDRSMHFCYNFHICQIKLLFGLLVWFDTTFLERQKSSKHHTFITVYVWLGVALHKHCTAVDNVASNILESKCTFSVVIHRRPYTGTKINAHCIFFDNCVKCFFSARYTFTVNDKLNTSDILSIKKQFNSGLKMSLLASNDTL